MPILLAHQDQPMYELEIQAQKKIHLSRLLLNYSDSLSIIISFFLSLHASHQDMTLVIT